MPGISLYQSAELMASANSSFVCVCTFLALHGLLRHTGLASSCRRADHLLLLRPGSCGVGGGGQSALLLRDGAVLRSAYTRPGRGWRKAGWRNCPCPSQTPSQTSHGWASHYFIASPTDYPTPLPLLPWTACFHHDSAVSTYAECSTGKWDDGV